MSYQFHVLFRFPYLDRRGGRDSRQVSDEEVDNTPDNASVISSQSDVPSVNGDGKLLLPVKKLLTCSGR